jgi:adenylate cyclase
MPGSVRAKAKWLSYSTIPMNRGAFDFVTKPIDFLDLEVTITKTPRHIELLRDARRRQAEAEEAYALLTGGP